MNALACCLKRRLGVAHCLAGASALIGAAAASLFAARSGAVLATALALIEVPVMLSVSSAVKKLVRGGRVIGSLKIDQATRAITMRLVSPVPIEQETLAFLVSSGLPVVDLGANSTVRLFAARQGKVIDGMVGLELDGPHVLLRSLAVSPALRGSGLGVALVGFAERAAAESGAVGLYLLTTTAADFFRRLDFVDLDRTHAPPAIAATQEFASLCPASSAFLYKRLEP